MRVRTADDQAINPLRMLCGVGDCRRTARPGHAEQAAPLDTGGQDRRFEILRVSCSRKVDTLTIREATTAPIVADDRMASRQEAEPRLPDRMIPVVVEMVHPVL